MSQFTKTMCKRHGKPMFMFKGMIGCTECFNKMSRTPEGKKKLSFSERVKFAFRKKAVLGSNDLVECQYHPGQIYHITQACQKCLTEAKDAG